LISKNTTKIFEPSSDEFSNLLIEVKKFF